MAIRSFAWFLAAGLLAAALPLSARGDDMGVMERARPDYDAKGLPLGGFRLKPMLDVSVSHDDNVYRTGPDTRGDIYVSVTPGFDLKSQWSNHMVELHGSLTHTQYTRNTKESRTDWDLGADGRLDILRGTYAKGEADYVVTHEPRYSPNQPGSAAEPTQYSDMHAEAGFTHAPGRLGLTLGGVFDRFNYNATPLTGGGLLNNDDRDENRYRATAKLRYAFSDHYAVFMRGRYDWRDFDRMFDRNGFDRTSHGYAADAGADFHLTHLVHGEFYAGYTEQSFHFPLSRAGGLDYGAKLTWYASSLMTFHLAARREFTDTTIFGASVSDDRIFEGGLDYELFRDLILQANARYTQSRFVGTARTDTIWDASFNAEYLMNRTMRATLNYSFGHRASPVPGQSFGDNTVTIGLKFAL